MRRPKLTGPRNLSSKSTRTEIMFKNMMEIDRLSAKNAK